MLAKGKSDKRQVSVPEMNGGLNTRDGITQVLDNQFTLSENVLFEHGICRGRKGFRTGATFVSAPYNRSGSATLLDNNQENECKVLEDIKIIQGYKTAYSLTRFANTVNSSRVSETVVLVRLEGIQSVHALPRLAIDGWMTATFAYYDGILYAFLSGYETDTKSQKKSVVCTYKYGDSAWNIGLSEKYIILSEQPADWSTNYAEYYVRTTDQKGKYHYTKNTSSTWDSMQTYARKTEETEYIPLIIVKGKRMRTGFSGDQVRSYNLLSKAYKIAYDAYNASDDDSNHPMMYPLPIKLCNGTVKAETTYYDGTSVQKCTHSVNVTNVSTHSTYGENTAKADGNYMYLLWSSNNQNYMVCFSPTKDSGAVFLNTAEALAKWNYENNIVITANWQDDIQSIGTDATWFGGSTQGFAAGTRIFTRERNIVRWSDVNNPLYFPENNYFEVGEETEDVTAFGKQSENLIIFKPSSTYYTKYQQNSDIDAAAIIAQSVVDYQTSSVYFPLILLNASIGCDLPETVQLCRNRLVWACKSGYVYTLVSSSQYSERTIFSVSDMIDRELTFSENTTAIDVYDKYFIFDSDAGEMYCMDYNSYGYQYVSGYSKTEDAKLKIPWWRFTLPVGEEDNFALMEIDGEIALFGNGIGGYDEDRHYMKFTPTVVSFRAVPNEKDKFIGDITTTESSGTYSYTYSFNETAIQKKAQTKVFDFGLPNYKKNIDKINLSLVNNQGEQIRVIFVTDSGEEEDFVTLLGEDDDNYSAESVVSVPLYPCIRSVIRAGVRLECDGDLYFDGISIIYTVLGGAR